MGVGGGGKLWGSEYRDSWLKITEIPQETFYNSAIALSYLKYIHFSD